jgi:hypothetical protein
MKNKKQEQTNPAARIMILQHIFYLKFCQDEKLKIEKLTQKK